VCSPCAVTVLCSVLQLQEAVRADQSRLSSQASQLESWQAQLSEQQTRLEELEAAAAETLAEARDAAAAALQDRDQVGTSCVQGTAWHVAAELACCYHCVQQAARCPFHG
jgi:peptidoglycan hydrolase CwlO-like protein